MKSWTSNWGSFFAILIVLGGMTFSFVVRSATAPEPVVEGRFEEAPGQLSEGSYTYNAAFAKKLVQAGMQRTQKSVRYDGSYFSLSYPGGDVPEHLGVCTDVVIRSYRALGIDLQVLVHEDMGRNFARYPSKQIWGLSRTDKNIDHRRVPNLETFFARQGQSLPVTKNVQDYRPGDLVTWRLPGNLPHIGIVSAQVASPSGQPLIIHNIGRGPQINDMIFDYPIQGHYRFYGENGAGEGKP